MSKFNIPQTFCTLSSLIESQKVTPLVINSLRGGHTHAHKHIQTLVDKRQPSAHFNILDFVQFSCTNTRSSSTNKLQYVYSSNNYSRNFYFTRLPRLWNRLPPVDLDQSLLTIKSTIYNYLWHHFNEHFISTNPCTFHFCCPCTICHGSIHNSNFSA